MDNDTANGLSNDNPNKQQASLEKKREGEREEGRRERYVFYSTAIHYHILLLSSNEN